MRLVTDRNGVFEVNWAWSPTSKGRMMAQLPRMMRVDEAAALDGCAHMHTDDPHEGGRDHDGYTRLVGFDVNTALGVTTLTWAKTDGETDGQTKSQIKSQAESQTEGRTEEQEKQEEQEMEGAV